MILDLDGFGTGNAKDALGTTVGSILHRGALNIHLENIHPWMPTVQLGMDVSTALGTARQGSSSVGTQAEYDLLSRNTGFDDGRAGQGIVLNWDNRPLDGIGIPGRINRFELAMASVGEGDDGLQSFTDRKDFVAYLGIEPFSQLKNKWISGLKFEMGSWFCNKDGRSASDACSRMRIQDLGNGGRQTLFDSGTGMGDGLAKLLMPGVTWELGPYTLRVAGGFQRYEDRGGTDGKKQGNMFLIGHRFVSLEPQGFPDRIRQHAWLRARWHPLRTYRRFLSHRGMLCQHQQRTVSSQSHSAPGVGFLLLCCAAHEHRRQRLVV
jgi:hypothetical protein